MSADERERRRLRLWIDPAVVEGPLADGWVELVAQDPSAARPARFDIGRAPDCVVRLHAPTVARHHARVFADDAGWWIEDLGSANGTFLDRTRVHGAARELTHGAEIRLGQALLIADDDRVPLEQEPAADWIAAQLGGDAPEQRRLALALVTLRREATPGAVDRLIGLLGASEAEVRLAAARATGAAGAAATAAVDPLLLALRGADAALRARAGESLGEIAAADTTWVSRVKPALEKALADETDPAARYGIAEGLSKIGRALAPRLGGLVKDPHRWGLRMASGEARTFRVSDDGAEPGRDDEADR